MPHSQDTTSSNSNDNDSKDYSNRIYITNELEKTKEVSLLPLNASSYIYTTDDGIVNSVKAQPINSSSTSDNDSDNISDNISDNMVMLFYL